MMPVDRHRSDAPVPSVRPAVTTVTGQFCQRLTGPDGSCRADTMVGRLIELEVPRRSSIDEGTRNGSQENPALVGRRLRGPGIKTEVDRKKVVLYVGFMVSLRLILLGWKCSIADTIQHLEGRCFPMAMFSYLSKLPYIGSLYHSANENIPT